MSMRNKLGDLLPLFISSCLMLKINCGSPCIWYHTVPPTPPKNINVDNPESCIYKEEKTGRYECELNLALGMSSGYIRKECVCPSYLFYPDIIKHPVCRNGMDNIKCQDCQNYSVDKRGPCLHNGTFRCRNDYHLAKDIKCDCPEGYTGYYCQTVKRVCSPDKNCCRLFTKEDRNIRINCTNNYNMHPCQHQSTKEQQISGSCRHPCHFSFYTLLVMVLYFFNDGMGRPT